ncbi:hypothetical protein TG4357_03553 [Thalassovita gelatinovora]|uniref:DUF2199 domain-containing protein n=1 Tax=Thalassovita gelatinovora TaxID=53501 RepID=A0A0N7LW87_THAGE|nr:DUF2199 domain-containing protein [Thalassovita gelatinovora]QIZ82343.1 DUF2199 domain-containing protein [Thalassovita gelatinovora]CUH68410.1 hypothetical protein TG4357_03553 [Thalassovita gelatinovora]SEQ51367.1 hypothetical protein SAMN04488043_10614 [Thalassovita gelatinovora]
MSLLDLDARWRRFNDPDRQCPCCGQSFSGVFDLGFDHPSSWLHEARDDRPFVKVGEDQLAPDLCRHGEDRFIRVVLSVPIQGSDDVFHMTPWVRLDPDAFYAYLDTFDGKDAPSIDECPADLANTLPGFEDATSAPLPVMLHFPDADVRPVATAQSGPLAQAQSDGISFDQLLDIYAAFGQDIRPHLLQD